MIADVSRTNQELLVLIVTGSWIELLTDSAQAVKRNAFPSQRDETMDAFAIRLKQDRVRHGLTVRQLAVRSGISFSYITKIETGNSGKGISPPVIRSLAASLNADLLEYLYLSNVVPSPFHELLSDSRSREFFRLLLNTGVSGSGWARLQRALLEDSRSTDRHMQVSAAPNLVEVGSGK